jgi:hypothetical protein
VELISQKRTVLLESPEDVILDVHQVMPSLSLDDYASLKQSIRIRGILEALYLDQDYAVVDGHNRVHIWRELLLDGIDIGVVPAHVISGDKYELHEIAVEKNVARRQLTPPQKRELARKELIFLAEKYEAQEYTGERTRSWDSNRLGRYLGMSHTLVREERRKLEDSEAIPRAFYLVSERANPHGTGTYETVTTRDEVKLRAGMKQQRSGKSLPDQEPVITLPITKKGKTVPLSKVAEDKREGGG